MKHEIHVICGQEVRIPVPESYRDCRVLIQSDSYRHNGRLDPLWRIWLGSLTRTSMAFSIWFRLAQHRRGWLYPLARLMANRFKRRCGIFLPPRTRVGYGLLIQHCFGIVVNPSAVIGNNVHLGQMTTIGASGPQAARIGDGVYLGPGLCTVDDVEIGSGSAIGAGAVVSRSIPPQTVAAGVPARPLKASDGSLTQHPWHLPD